ncbi:hypothetical protein DICPUDRAFT_82156 [Dictyostelium purpureum]|uniref:NTF2 domain-containing protein n=1 Tax=Dictyostelium purpureum TaxID=5786 RepID=F0ZVP5_DICPU|nr:uncharacterized protein DICPUDRAFT_82156 [Dictyostelium purpureum]EGC31993.1 hypothetical protein DICPUDRAFT_82156 [Dictyostelium purpureum]|eukprot:XP_003291491.1 hypothetical protein DICPUDRAFT_82156 [Dictyostelium purpureum]
MSFKKFNNNPSNNDISSYGNVDENLKKIVETISPRAEAFVKEYFYNMFDNNRGELVQLYKDDSVSIWNGTECKGKEHIGKLLAEIPKSKHIVETFDCQPMPGEDKENPNLLINASGKVTYGESSTHEFHQTFYLAKDPTNPNIFFISFDCIRLNS